MPSLRSPVSIAFPLALALGGAACPSYTTIPEGTQKHIQETREGALLWLKQSMYAGPFYDDDRFRLIDPRPFAELDYLRTAEGDPITPPPAEGIIPAGTRVRVERVAFPTGDNVFQRPLFTPRYTTWVYLRVARARGDVTLERPERHILLLPAFLDDKESFDRWFDALLGADDPNPWIRSLPEEQQRGIFEKRPVVGMDYEALTAAMGFPDRLTRDVVTRNGRSMTVEVAIYGATSVVLEDGRVVRVSTPGREGT